jgi:hypothetical protein
LIEKYDGVVKRVIDIINDETRKIEDKILEDKFRNILFPSLKYLETQLSSIDLLIKENQVVSAIILSRSLFEYHIDLIYINQDKKKRAEMFWEYYKNYLANDINYLRKTGNEPKAHSIEEYLQIEVNGFTREFPWSNKNIKERFDELFKEKEDNLHMYSNYALLSRFVHLTPILLENIVDTTMLSKYKEYCYSTSIGSALTILRIINDEFVLDKLEQIDEINSEVMKLINNDGKPIK